MEEWKNIRINGIVEIERLVEEFEVWEHDKIPHGKFKVRVYETSKGRFIGRTNLMIRDKTNDFCAGIGYGENVCEALRDTIRYFFSLIDEVHDLSSDCFKYTDAMDF
ncbi:MAG: hypothetical protein E7260_07425 [Lachnospiraceae bacterium]|nr:hypothetical protein [Lachnospiraceae bacterium]